MDNLLSPICEETLLHPERLQAARDHLLDAHAAAQLTSTFQALADPNRLRLISALLEQEMCVCDLATLLGMTQSAVSHQLRILRNLRLVRFHKEGRVVYYALDDDHIRSLFQLSLEHIIHETLRPA